MNPQTEYWKDQAELAKILIKSSFPGNGFPVNEMRNWIESVNKPIPQDNHEWPADDIIHSKIMNVINSYQTTHMVYLKQVHGNKTLMIDPMDFHKIANELTEWFRNHIRAKFDPPITDKDGKPVELDEGWLPWGEIRHIPEDRDFEIKLANGKVFNFLGDWDKEDSPIMYFRMLQKTK